MSVATESLPTEGQNGTKAAAGTNGAVATPEEDRAGQPSGKTIFVLNLPTLVLFSYEQELRDIFSTYGEIKEIKRAGIQVDGNSSDITISAYIHFTTTEAADNSVAERGRLVGGNPIEVCVLKIGPNTVVADNLPVTMRVECLRNLLAACGNIKELFKVPGRRSAFIEFEDQEGATKALSLNNKIMINNVKILIDKRVGNSKPVVQQKPPAPKKAVEVKRPFKRPGGVAWRGGYSGGPQQSFQSSPRGGGGFRGQGAPRGGRMFRGGFVRGVWNSGW